MNLNATKQYHTISQTNVMVSPNIITVCGKISVLGKNTTESSNQAEDCFYHAYQSCTPAALVFTQAGVDAGSIHNLKIFKDRNTCKITDTIQSYIAPRPPSTRQTSLCSILNQKPDGLHITGCSNVSEIVIPK